MYPELFLFFRGEYAFKKTCSVSGRISNSPFAKTKSCHRAYTSLVQRTDVIPVALENLPECFDLNYMVRFTNFEVTNTGRKFCRDEYQRKFSCEKPLNLVMCRHVLIRIRWQSKKQKWWGIKFKIARVWEHILPWKKKLNLFINWLKEFLEINIWEDRKYTHCTCTYFCNTYLF
jgi:hypothetical protein